MARITVFLALFALIISIALAETPPSFCKCTCFTNSTIIALTSHSTTSSATKPSLLHSRAAAGTCATCNKAFCLSQRLPICKDAEEKDVVTVCFQRDSRKDQIVVLTFITGTVGLLAWAGVRRVLRKRKEKGLRAGETTTGQGYAPVGGR